MISFKRENFSITTGESYQRELRADAPVRHTQWEECLSLGVWSLRMQAAQELLLNAESEKCFILLLTLYFPPVALLTPILVLVEAQLKSTRVLIWFCQIHNATLKEHDMQMCSAVFYY